MMRTCAWCGLWLAMALARVGMAAEPVAQAVPEQVTEASASTLLQQGRATWYGGHRHGHRTANGERFDAQALTAAHPSLPMGSWVRVVNQANGREVQVRINDRGPRGQRFIIDLSEAAAQRLGFRRRGWAQVELHRSTPKQAQQSMPWRASEAVAP